MTTFERQLVVPVPATEAYDWHAREGAFARLGAPWDEFRPVSVEPLANGSTRIFDVKKGGVWLRWVAKHRDVVAGERFTDVQAKGPFKRWEHQHLFEAIDGLSSRLTDRIEYEMPMGLLGRTVAGRLVRSDVERMFDYRHRVTLGDLTAHAKYRGKATLRVAISGASGQIGRQLVAFLRTGGHQVFRLVRRSAHPAADEIRWSVKDGVRDVERLEGLDAIVHLAGANVAQRWTADVRRDIRDSRVLGTRALVQAIATLSKKPRVFISASGVAYYGETGSLVVDEQARRGKGFLADVCVAWEEETQRAQAHGCRTVILRTGLVLDPSGGALKKLLPFFKAGLGGRVGDGNQLMSCIAQDDVLTMVLRALQHEDMDGVFNVVGPEPVSQMIFAATLGKVLSRPAIAPAPAAVIEKLYGEMGKHTILSSIGVKPTRFIEHGYVFRYPTLEATLRHCLGC